MMTAGWDTIVGDVQNVPRRERQSPSAAFPLIIIGWCRPKSLKEKQ